MELEKVKIDYINNALEDKKKISSGKAEYWTARELFDILDYRDWDNFEDVIIKGIVSCEKVGENASNHFREFTDLVEIGSGGKRKRKNYYLSRYACYLIAMNGDPKKYQISVAQTYFAIQTRRMEMDDALTETEKRLQLRNRVKHANKYLNKAAKNAGVQSYGLFHDAGYQGLYGMRLGQIKQHKGIDQKEDLLDLAGRDELAANEFRITQCEQKLNTNNIKGQQEAMSVHKTVGEEVRSAIMKIGGVMPENMRTETSIKKLTRKKRKLKGNADS